MKKHKIPLPARPSQGENSAAPPAETEPAETEPAETEPAETEPPLSRLDRLRAQAAKIEEEREVRLAARAEAAEIEKLEAAIAIAPILAEIEEKHGADRVRLVDTIGGPVIVTAPHVATFRKFQDIEKVRSEDFIKLLKPCVAFPEWAETTDLLKSRPGVLTLLCNAVVALAGHRAADLEGK